jgi:hypothetical protein
MFSCYEGSVWLILDMPCPLGTVAGQKFVGFQQSETKIKVDFNAQRGELEKAKGYNCNQ